jgi:dienelactone hydrolase
MRVVVVLAALIAFVASSITAEAQQAVRVPVEVGGRALQLAATLYRPQQSGRHPAVALFHGCGGVGQNNLRMAQLLAAKGYVALVVDSFGARSIRDACTTNWPTQAQALERVGDIQASVQWLMARSDVDAARIGVMGYSYGGGVALLYALISEMQERALAVATMDGPSSRRARAVIAVYPDCALQDGLGDSIGVWQPLMIAMGGLDDWTPKRQCDALLGRVKRRAELIETHVYPDAHHSFDAVGLSVRYLAAAGNRSKPNNCCGAHYGYNEAAWIAFQRDVEAFFGRHLR